MTKWISKAATTCVLAWAASLASAEEITVLFGIPSFKVSESSNGVAPETLRPEKQQENIAIIEKRDGRYFWVSRKDRELLHKVSGAFHLFIDPENGSYIKVYAFDDGKGFEYMEHVHIMLSTITYHGTSKAFNP